MDVDDAVGANKDGASGTVPAAEDAIWIVEVAALDKNGIRWLKKRALNGKG